MKRVSSLIASMATLTFAGLAFATSNAGTSFTPEQEKEIGKIVQQYLMDNPSIIDEISKKAELIKVKEAKNEIKLKITKNLEELLDSDSPSMGSSNNDMVIVEFLDYRCGYCKRMNPVMKEILDKHKNARIIYKNISVLGPDSTFAATAALAAQKQNKFAEFHNALLDNHSSLDQNKIMEIAIQSGLNEKKLALDMKLPETLKQLNQNSELAKKLGILGTPAFIMISHPKDPNKRKIEYVPGATSSATFNDFIEANGQ